MTRAYEAREDKGLITSWNEPTKDVRYGVAVGSLMLQQVVLRAMTACSGLRMRNRLTDT